MNRRQFGAAVAALGVTSVTTGAETAVHVERLQLSRNGWMPNNERLPVLLYRREFEVTGDVLGEWKRGMDKGEVRKVCTEPNCLIHHSKKQQTKGDSSLKVEQEKRRREEAIAATAGMRILAAIADAIPVRLMKRDLLFVAERLLPLLDDRRPLILGKGRSIRPKCDEAIGKLLTAHARKADEGTLGKLIVEAVILLSVCSGNTAEKALKTAAQTYKV